MEFHEIDMQGRIWVEEVSALPTWHPSYQRRVLQRTTDRSLWYGGSASWIRIQDTVGTGSGGVGGTFIRKDVADEHAGTITPSADNSINLGAGSYRYANVYAVNFQGTVTTATYADLAEKYTTPEEYPVGTVLKVSENENYDLEKIGSPLDIVSGIISENPGFVMNSELDGQIVGLTGRVPVRVWGQVIKGRPLVPSHDGIAIMGDAPGFAIALETKLDIDEGLVECLIK